MIRFWEVTKELVWNTYTSPYFQGSIQFMAEASAGIAASFYSVGDVAASCGQLALRTSYTRN